MANGSYIDLRTHLPLPTSVHPAFFRVLKGAKLVLISRWLWNLMPFTPPPTHGKQQREREFI